MTSAVKGLRVAVIGGDSADAESIRSIDESHAADLEYKNAHFSNSFIHD
jgi:hypothetical protein